MAYDSGWRKSIASWTEGGTLCLSVPFTWQVSAAEELARNHDGPVIAGGPGVRLLYPDGCPWAETPAEPPRPVLPLFHPQATYTTRGCPNHCPYCAVPQIEGEFRTLDDYEPKPIICDANILAADPRHFRSVLDRLIDADAPFVDFNQGLDAARFSSWHAHRLALFAHYGRRVKVRFAFDRLSGEDAVGGAIHRAKEAGISERRISVYVLVGFEDTFEEARWRRDGIVD